MKSKENYIYAKKEFSTNKNEENKFKIYQKVRDHCRYTGKFRGAAHSICNLSYKVPREIPVVFHNGSTYDYHFIIKQLAEEFKGQFRCLGENTEKYITFSVPIKKEHDNGKTTTYKLKFIDSFRFMPTLLSNFANNLSEINKNTFYGKLNLENITVKNYAHVQKVWEIFEIKNRGEYHDLYVQCDTLLLADVFENFRDKCIEIYKLDPAHFFTCTRISMTSLLKKNRSKFRIINRY